MNTKLQLVRDNLDGLDEHIASLYEEKDGKFHLNLEGYEDPAALKRAKDHEKTARQTAERALKDLRTEFDEFKAEIERTRDDKHRKTGNIAELDASWQAKLDEANKKHDGEVAQLKGQISKLLVDNVAEKMAAELSDTPEFLVELIKKRLKVEDGVTGPETRVLDAAGALSATTIDELRDEFKANKKYAAIIRGSQANGGGSGGGGNGGGAPKAFKDMSEKERIELNRTNPAEYTRQFNEFRSQQSAT